MVFGSNLSQLWSSSFFASRAHFEQMIHAGKVLIVRTDFLSDLSCRETQIVGRVTSHHRSLCVGVVDTADVNKVLV